MKTLDRGNRKVGSVAPILDSATSTSTSTSSNATSVFASSLTGKKRKFEDAFEIENYEESRYGQPISADFFTYSTSESSSSSVLPRFVTSDLPPSDLEEGEVYEGSMVDPLTGEKIRIQDMAEWAYYLENRNLFNI